MLDRLKKLLAPKPPATPAATPPAADSGILINAYCTRQGVPAPAFPHKLNSRRGLNEPEMAGHLDGFIRYVRGRGDGQMNRARYHVIRHIERTQEQLSFWIDESQFDAYSAWAAQANAIAFLPDGSLRDTNMRVLISAGGETDPEAEIPHPREAWERKKRTDALLAARGIPVPEHLPPLVSEGELQPRPPREIAGRALALLAVAVRAETFNSGDPMPISELRESLPLAFDHLTPLERAFLETDAPDQKDVVQFAWRYECVYLLEWALGLAPTLPFPAAICDVPLTARILREAGSEDLLRTAATRPAGEILDALDLHYRLHWLVRQARVDGRPVPEGLDGGVILERHYALNWLARFENADWDDVETPT